MIVVAVKRIVDTDGKCDALLVREKLKGWQRRVKADWTGDEGLERQMVA